MELTALWANQDGQQPREMADIRVTVKEAHDVWSADSVAFAICHASFNRRLAWRVAETSPLLPSLTAGGYGRGVGKGHEAVKNDFDVFLPWQTKDYYTAETALRDVQNQVKRQLKEK